MKLYTNWFSPFARKVALALDYKGLVYDAVDGLAHANNAELKALNPRAEVPALVDGDLVVVNSADILAYLDHRYPKEPIYPADPAQRVAARALERLSDSRLDAILVDCSYWTWANRKDAPPKGLFEAGQRDIDKVLNQIEAAFGDSESTFLFGETPGVAEFALWPQLTALRPLGFAIDQNRFRKTAALFGRLRRDDLFRADTARTKAFLSSFTPETHEMTKIFWRGDRIEWMLARGFHDWFVNEIREDRVIWPD
ncbi:MAG: glutathione S-transferase family protein [Pseudomonadota bacterium]